MRCHNCIDSHQEYIMLYEHGEDQPSLIHVWDLSGEEPILIEKIKLCNNLLSNLLLEPKFFCMGCNSLLPNALPKEIYAQFFQTYEGDK